jgi:hypothetical protein
MQERPDPRAEGRISDRASSDARSHAVGDCEGLCATLDIQATEMAGPATWVVDGVVHPVAMAG